jgi:hypothetical protein
MGAAVTLARWIATGGRPAAAGQVLRKADVAAAGAALGVEVPPRLRTMADIRALHRPWCVGVATGLLRVDGGWVTGGPALKGWPPGDADLLAGWLAGLPAVCAAESYPRDEDSVRLQALALLMVLDILWTPGRKVPSCGHLDARCMVTWPPDAQAVLESRDRPPAVPEPAPRRPQKPGSGDRSVFSCADKRVGSDMAGQACSRQTGGRPEALRQRNTNALQ